LIFENWELQKIIDSLGDDVSSANIKIKIEKIMASSVHKRYSLRTTDWLVENGRKSARNRKKKTSVSFLGVLE
jgi:hypothetical protein